MSIREFTQMIKLGRNTKSITEGVLNGICAKHKLVLIGGFAGTRAKEVFENYRYKTGGYTCTKWDRKPIFKMLSEEEVPDKFNNYMRDLESNVLGDALDFDEHRVIVYAPFLTRRSRGDYLRINKGYKAATIFFDGPQDLRLSEMIQNMDVGDAQEIMMLEEAKFSPPEINEGYSNIIYCFEDYASKDSEKAVKEYVRSLGWKKV